MRPRGHLERAGADRLAGEIMSAFDQVGWKDEPIFIGHIIHQVWIGTVGNKLHAIRVKRLDGYDSIDIGGGAGILAH